MIGLYKDTSMYELDEKYNNHVCSSRTTRYKFETITFIFHSEFEMYLPKFSQGIICCEK